MVTDKQNKQKQNKTKGKIKGGLLEEQKIPQQIYVGLGPKQGRCLQKILFREQNCVKYDCEFSESKTASSMTANFPRAKLRQVWLRIFERKTASSMTANFRKQNCVKGDCEFLASKTASKVTANFFKSKLRQIWLRIFSQHLSLKSLLAPSSWDRINDPQLAEVVLKPTYCWSCYVADVRERAADQMTKIKQ